MPASHRIGTSASSRGSPPVLPWQGELNHDPPQPSGSSVSTTGSRQSSFPVGDFRTNTQEEINDIKCEIVVNWLHSQQEEKLWTSGRLGEGVVLKKARGKYTSAPADLMEDEGGFFSAIQALNVRVSHSSSHLV